MPFPKKLSHSSSSYKKLENPSRSNSVVLVRGSSMASAAGDFERESADKESHSADQLHNAEIPDLATRIALNVSRKVSSGSAPLLTSSPEPSNGYLPAVQEHSGFQEFSPLKRVDSDVAPFKKRFEHINMTHSMTGNTTSVSSSRRVSLSGMSQRQLSQSLLRRDTNPILEEHPAEQYIKRHISRLGTMSSLHPEPIPFTKADEESLLNGNNGMAVSYSTDCLKQVDNDNPPDPASSPDSPLQPLTIWQRIQSQIGIICMILSTVVFCLLGMAVKAISISSEPVPTMQIIVIRGLTGWLISLGLMKYQGVQNIWFGPPGCRSLLFARGIIGFIALSFGWWTLTVLSVADATVIGFLSPVFTGILGRLFLNEPWEVSDAIAAFVSLTGVIFIARPTFIFGNTFQKKSQVVPSVFPGGGPTTATDPNDIASDTSSSRATSRFQTTQMESKSRTASASPNHNDRYQVSTFSSTTTGDHAPANVAYHVFSVITKRWIEPVEKQPAYFKTESAMDYVGGLLPGELSELSKRGTLVYANSTSDSVPGYIDANEIDFEGSPGIGDSSSTLPGPSPSTSAETADDALRFAGVLSGLASAVFVALALIIIRKLSSRTHTLHVVSSFHLLSVPFALIMAPILPKAIEPRPWIMPQNVSTWCLLLSTAISGLAGQMLMSVGLAREKAGRAASMNYIQAVFAFFFEWLFWGTIPHWMSLLGGFVVVACVMTVAFFKKSQ